MIYIGGHTEEGTPLPLSVFSPFISFRSHRSSTRRYLLTSDWLEVSSTGRLSGINVRPFVSCVSPVIVAARERRTAPPPPLPFVAFAIFVGLNRPYGWMFLFSYDLFCLFIVQFSQLLIGNPKYSAAALYSKNISFYLLLVGFLLPCWWSRNTGMNWPTLITNILATQMNTKEKLVNGVMPSTGLNTRDRSPFRPCSRHNTASLFLEYSMLSRV